MTEPTTAYIAIGSNLGDRHRFIESALNMLAENDDIEVVRAGTVNETEPLAAPDQPKYLNTVAELKTTLTAEGLYSTLVKVETCLGRQRSGKWAPRTVDLDILLFGQDVINLPDLIVPHPQMHIRSFVLSSLCELDSGLLHPVLQESVDELSKRLNGMDFVRDPNRPQLISIAGVVGVGKTTLARYLADALDCEILLEPYDTNPYLADVYAGRKDLALNSQLYFLTTRSEQLSIGELPAGQIVVSDYIFDQDPIYARRWLDSHQFALYEKIYPALAAKVSSPVLVIYMQDTAEQCLQRIRSRNRPYERYIGPHFLESLGSDYERLFADWKACPVIRLSTSEFDCMCESDIEHLADQIRYYVAE